MVRRLLVTVTTAAVSVALLLTGGPAAGTAQASPTASPPTPGTTVPPPLSRDPNPPSGQQNTGTGGGSTGEGDCSVFASPGRLGVACGRYTSDPLSNIITPGELPWCWDEVIPEQRLGVYGYQPVAGESYYIHSCLTSPPDLTKSAGNQAGMNIDQRIVVIPDSGGDCPTPYSAAQVGVCQMVLTAVQTTFVRAVSAGSIPSIVITTHPSATVRTNVATGFADVSFDLQGDQITDQTVPLTADNVSVYAKMVRFVIYPYGMGSNTAGDNCPGYSKPAGTEPTSPGACETCTGVVTITPQLNPTNSPGDCWWDYTKSSDLQQGTKNAYSFRAEVDWQIMVNDGDGYQPYLVVKRFDDLDLPVLDVQSLGYGGQS